MSLVRTFVVVLAGTLVVSSLSVTGAAAADFKFTAGTELAKVCEMMGLMGRLKVTSEGDLGKLTADLEMRQIEPADALRQLAQQYKLKVEESGSDDAKAFVVKPGDGSPPAAPAASAAPTASPSPSKP